jgi:hypothetical protein
MTQKQQSSSSWDREGTARLPFPVQHRPTPWIAASPSHTPFEGPPPTCRAPPCASRPPPPTSTALYPGGIAADLHRVALRPEGVAVDLRRTSLCPERAAAVQHPAGTNLEVHRVTPAPISPLQLSCPCTPNRTLLNGVVQLCIRSRLCLLFRRYTQMDGATKVSTWSCKEIAASMLQIVGGGAIKCQKRCCNLLAVVLQNVSGCAAKAARRNYERRAVVLQPLLAGAANATRRSYERRVAVLRKPLVGAAKSAPWSCERREPMLRRPLAGAAKAAPRS